MLGPIQNEGNDMAQAELTSKVTFIPRRSFRKLLVPELHSETEKLKRQLFEDVIRKKIGDEMALRFTPLLSNFSLTLMKVSQLPFNYQRTSVLPISLSYKPLSLI